MKSLLRLLALCSVLCAALPASAFDIYGQFGLTTLAADDLERVFEAIEDDLGGTGLAADFSAPSNGIDLSVGARQVVHPWISIGIEGGFTFDTVSNNSTGVQVSYNNHADSRIGEVLGILELHPPSVPLLHFGAGFGYATASHTFKQDLFVDPEGAPPEFYDTRLEADGGGTMWTIFAGIETPDPTGFFLMARAGYRGRNLGAFEGTYYEDDVLIGEGTVVGADGSELEFDFSGVYLHIGIGYRFGVAGPAGTRARVSPDPSR